MKEWFKEYFYYTRAERRGLNVLTSLLLILTLLPQVYPYIFKNKEQYDFEETRRIAAAFKQMDTTNNVAGELSFQQIELFPFNPNTASKEELIRLGLSPKVANTISNFRNKGGKFYKPEDLKKIWGLAENDYNRLKEYINMESDKFVAHQRDANQPAPKIEYFSFNPNIISVDDFVKLGVPLKTANLIANYRNKSGKFRKKEDLKKIYGFPEEVYTKLEPYIDFGQNDLVQTNNQASNSNVPTAIPKEYTNNSVKKYTPVNIDINKATEEEWQKLNGIGPGYAKRIINFREKLGGFYAIEQVKETFGLPDSTFQKVKNQLIVSPILRKININTATAEELKTHPYLKWQQINILTNYKKQHDGKITNWEEMKKIQGISPDVLEKIKPYIAF